MAEQSAPLERIIDRLHELDDETLVEVRDFVEFVCQKKEKKGKTLRDFLQTRALASVSLE